MINIDSSQDFNGIIMPGNYANQYNSQILANQDLESYVFYKDIEEYILKFSNDRVSVGNNIDYFGRSNNGDIDDWAFFSKSLYSMSLYISPYKYGPATKFSYFLEP